MKQSIEFPEGSILLSGDIGAGKTSILLGIEFALFGLQPGQRGTSLLRNGEKEGMILIEFEIDGKQILVERTLKRGKTVSQDYCAITVDGEKREISVTELKDKVLELLSYPKEFSKKQNLLYRFTVYTPQEEMKQIILQDPETRLNTLRHVFGIDKYKKILENASILTSKMREEKRIKEGLIEYLDKDRANLTSKEEDLESKHYNLASVEKELFLKTEERKKIQEEKEEIIKKIEEKIKFQQEIEKTKIMVSNKKESTLNHLKTIEQLENQVRELQDLKFDESEIQRLEQELVSKKGEVLEFEEINLRLTTEINSMNLKNQENESIKDKIRQIEVCPTCLQDVDPAHKSNVVGKLDSNTHENLKKIETLTFEKKALQEKLYKIKMEISLKQNKIQELNILKIRLQEIQEKQKRIEEIKKSNELIQKDMEILNQQTDVLNKSVFELNKFDNIFEVKRKELEKALAEERTAEIKVAELRKEIEVFSKQIQELKDRISATEEIKEKLNYISKLENWLSKNFTPLLSFILFARWFSMLVSDTFDVRLDDDFTPMIEYQDYEINYSYLSGGERTAIALAYRLSLNQVVNSLLSKIKTKDIVILDEPTDGFSEQQLDKMRDVLEQLNVKQLIIVSHEQKIEGFVENVIRLRKDHGVSRTDK